VKRKRGGETVGVSTSTLGKNCLRGDHRLETRIEARYERGPTSSEKSPREERGEKEKNRVTVCSA